MRPRILVVHPFPDVYGADRVLLDAVMAMRAAGMQPLLVVPEPGPMLERLDEASVPYRCVKAPVFRRAMLQPRGLARMLFGAPLDFHRISKTLHSVRPDLVYVNTITMPHWVIGARMSGLPVIVHCHESDQRIRPVLSAPMLLPLARADRVVAVSEAAKSFLQRIGAIQDRIRVVYNGIPAPLGTFNPPMQQAPVRLAVIGRLSPNKGQDLALEAIRKVVDNGFDVHLEFVGGVFPGWEWFEQSLRETVKVLRLQDRVSFTGYSQDVFSILRETDIVLAPSRTDSLPLVVIEAMLAARPIVASNVGGIGELIEDARSGVLVPAQDVDALVAAVGLLLKDIDFARSIGSAAQKRAQERFALERFQRDIVEQVADVLSEAPHTAPKHSFRSPRPVRRASG